MEKVVDICIGQRLGNLSVEDDDITVFKKMMDIVRS
jgi:hypothetical protein